MTGQYPYGQVCPVPLLFHDIFIRQRVWTDSSCEYVFGSWSLELSIYCPKKFSMNIKEINVILKNRQNLLDSRNLTDKYGLKKTS